MLPDEHVLHLFSGEKIPPISGMEQSTRFPCSYSPYSDASRGISHRFMGTICVLSTEDLVASKITRLKKTYITQIYTGQSEKVLCWTNCRLDSNFQTQTSGHPINFTLGKHSTRISLSLEITSGKNRPPQSECEFELSDWKVCVCLPRYHQLSSTDEV